MIFLNIKVLDTTLRDGEQTPGVSLTASEKFRIANQLDEIGIDYIEAGSAITSNGERESIKEITKQGFNAQILSFSNGVNDTPGVCSPSRNVVSNTLIFIKITEKFLYGY